MRYEWYIDLYLLINLLMDAGLLWSLGKVFQIPLRWRQIVSGAAFGAVGACGEAWIRLLLWDIGTKMGVPMAKVVVGIQVISIILLLLFPAGMIRLCFGRRDWRTFLKLYVMLYLEAFLANCPKLQKVWMLQEEVEDVPSGVYSINELRNTGISASADASCPAAEDIATIIFTSGTTGKSKGVMLTQNNLASNVEAVKISAEPGTAMLSVLPIHHAFCLVMDWLKGFSQGATICINDSLLHMVRNMSIFKPDIMLMVPMMIETIYKRLAAADPEIPKAVLAEKVFGGKLQTIFTGGAHLDPYYIDRFAEYGVQILEGYGMSECSPVISNNTPENHKPGSIGRPLENVEIRFENGEILVKGTSVMKGYYQMPDETAETLKDGWLHTGDKGYMDEDGYLFINGRVKNLIILSNGENISPEEIENKLALNPLVGEVIVTGEDNGLTARIYPEQAVVEAKALDTEMIRSQLQEFLDEYNKNQPTYRRITGLVIRKNPFIRSTTKKIRRQDVLIDEPQA